MKDFEGKPIDIDKAFNALWEINIQLSRRRACDVDKLEDIYKRLWLIKDELWALIDDIEIKEKEKEKMRRAKWEAE